MACVRSGCLLSTVPPFLSPAVELPASVIAGWPPRSRTERYRLIGAAPSTGWVVASRWRRSRPPARPRPSGFKPEAATRQLHHPGAEDGGPDPLRSPAHPTSNRGPPPWRFHLPRPPVPASGRLRRMEIPTPSAVRRPSAFQAEPASWPVHPPSEEGGRLERQGVTPASVSNGARRACPVHLPFVPNRGFEPRTSWFWARRLYLSWASSACERLTGFEPATSTMARWCSCLLSYNRMEPSPGADPGETPIPRASGRRSEGHRSGSWTRTSVRLHQGQAGMPSTHPGTNCRPCQVPSLASRPDKGRPPVGAGDKYARRDSNPHQHGPQPCPSTLVAARAHKSRHPGSNRAA